MPDTPELFVSGYTEAGSGAGPGIVRFALDPDGLIGERLAQSAGVLNPSFLAFGAGGLLAVEELAQARIAALLLDDLAVAGRAGTKGADACHVNVAGEAVWVANYSSGDVAVLPLAELIENAVPAHAVELLSNPGSGPVTERQEGSHAHQVIAGGNGTMLVADLGADRIDEYDADTHALVGSAELPPGTGPRHMVLKGEHLLVAGELDGHLHVLRRAGGDHAWRWLFRVPLAADAADIAGDFYPSHVELSADGATLYAAVRGPNTIVALDVTGIPGDDATAQEPKLLRLISSGGNWPRHFAIHGEKLYVANQLSNNVAVFALDAHGLPGELPVQTIEFGSATCVLVRQ